MILDLLSYLGSLFWKPFWGVFGWFGVKKPGTKNSISRQISVREFRKMWVAGTLGALFVAFVAKLPEDVDY